MPMETCMHLIRCELGLPNPCYNFPFNNNNNNNNNNKTCYTTCICLVRRLPLSDSVG